MKFRHTEGPWEWGSKYTKLYNPVTGVEILSTGPYENMWLSDKSNSAEREANARLIKAAPALLTALLAAKEALILWETEHPCCAGMTDTTILQIEELLSELR